MNLTDQQKAIIESSGNAKIHAVAGSGKTSTLVEFAKARGKRQQVLYIAFNRSVRTEARERFSQADVKNVRIETAHSLAYNHIVNGSIYNVRPGYKPADIIKLLNLTPINKDPLSAVILASHILRYATYFCNQSVKKVNDLDYATQVRDEPAISFVKKHYASIQDGTRRFLAKMNSAEIEITHEFYLKKFQLSEPQLRYDYILFDEGQDASPVMLDIFLKQEHATKIIVGDIHQQIYSWRYAVNALVDIDFKDYSLTTSFRFPQTIADLAMKCLSWKSFFTPGENPIIKGVGKPSKIHLKATLARTNLSLLKSAIDMTSSSKNRKKVYFEGNLSSYTYASEGASIWDVLNLYLDRHDTIRDPVVSAMKSFDQLSEYAEMSEDVELLTLIEMVEEYGKELPYLIKTLKDNHLPDENRNKADMIFSTVHRCKGMEYDSVILKDDFINESDIKRQSAKKDLSQFEIDKIAEEINLVYVALTRSKNKLLLPPDLFEQTPEKMKSVPIPKKTISRSAKTSNDNHKNTDFQAYSPWTIESDTQLRKMVRENVSIKQIATRLGRKPGAILSRMKELAL